jgi:hypothetical protein
VGYEPPYKRHWFIFGVHDDGTVDLSDGDSDVLIGIPKDFAEQVMKYRDATAAFHRGETKVKKVVADNPGTASGTTPGSGQ